MERAGGGGGDAHLHQHGLDLAARHGAERNDHAAPAPLERPTEHAVELHAVRELDRRLDAARHGGGERVGLGGEDLRQGGVVLDEVVLAVRLLGDGREEELVVVDVDADGGAPALCTTHTWTAAHAPAAEFHRSRKGS